jgi:hypothetical protein
MNAMQTAFAKVKMQRKVVCPYCQSQAEKVTGEKIYPHRPDLYHKTFWECEPCDAYVGCHPNTDTPLGRLADIELREAKMRAHAVFDPIWKGGDMKRGEAYGWLAKQLGIKKQECHIGMFDVETCERVVVVCAQTNQEGK